MPHVIEKTVFNFDELSDAAKEKARDWFRDGQFDYEWWDSVYDDADQCAKLLGIDLDRKRGTASPAIWFSGFSSQGDGACFEGSYVYAKGAAKAIRQHAPVDLALHKIADELQKIQRENFYRLTARMTHRGHYYHSGCMTVDVDGNSARTKSWADSDEAITRLMRDFADWIYRQLETEHDWMQADAQVDDSIRANEYTFDESGRRDD